MNNHRLQSRYEILEELPNSSTRLVYIPNEGPGLSRDGIIVRFSPLDGDPWIGVFAFGEMTGETGIFPGPGDIHLLTVLAKGEAYIVNMNDPSWFHHVDLNPVIRAIPISKYSMMVFHDFTDIVAYNEKGLIWETGRISWDGIEIHSITDEELLGESWDAPSGEKVTFRVRLSSGFHIGGSSPPGH